MSFFKTASLVNQYFFKKKHFPDLNELHSLNLSKPEKRQLLTTIRNALFFEWVLKTYFYQFYKKKSLSFGLSVLMIALQETLLHKSPLFHVSKELKQTLGQLKLSWLYPLVLPFFKEIREFDFYWPLFLEEISKEPLIADLLTEHPGLNISFLFRHPPFGVRFEHIDDLELFLTNNPTSKKIPSISNFLIAAQSSTELTALFNEGKVSYQDAAAFSLYQALPNIAPKVIYDCCAAPGGKSTILMKKWPEASFYLTDIKPSRLESLKENIDRFFKTQKKPSVIQIAEHDWSDEPFKGEKADLILVDAPCSGLGVTARHPDILWTRNNENLIKNQHLQSKILDSAALLLNAGGYLIYATCSLSSVENDKVVELFLKSHSDFEAISISLSLGCATLYGSQILPTNEHDGLYFCLLLKK